ncbi:MAG TPA: N-acetyl-gamma-glutamyl-phosphate reductase [Vicinamibacteria bacterium]|nr:N-acetyl-gamma-glutamyl-phosphate reductase [Vicinamibacteria bacterium]
MWSASVVGASGYAGGELLRLLLGHGGVSLQQASSESFAGKPLARAHPHLRGLTDLRFETLGALRPADVVFCCLPHGVAAEKWSSLTPLGERFVDLSADFRLHDPSLYARYYGRPHPRPEVLSSFVCGIPELHRDAIRGARRVACAGCNATAAILGLYPLFRAGVADEERTVIEVKAGSSEAGRKATSASHHPERSGSVRSFAPTGHRHTAEIVQALSNGRPVEVHLSLTAVERVRGASATSHVFAKGPITEKELWRIFREAYRGEPFLRLVKERQGTYRYPDAKLLSGTNFADVGFELDESRGRIVVLSAIDNLMKGAAGQAVQCMNLMLGLDERTGLGFSGLHPL